MSMVPYVYVWDNPLKYVNPDGEWPNEYGVDISAYLPENIVKQYIN